MAFLKPMRGCHTGWRSYVSTSCGVSAPKTSHTSFSHSFMTWICIYTSLSEYCMWAMRERWEEEQQACRDLIFMLPCLQAACELHGNFSHIKLAQKSQITGVQTASLWQCIRVSRWFCSFLVCAGATALQHALTVSLLRPKVTSHWLLMLNRSYSW